MSIPSGVSLPVVEVFLLAVSLVGWIVPRTRWRRLAGGVAVFLLLRIVAFETPIAWSVYSRLDPEQIGWRQWDVVEHGPEAVGGPRKGAPILAVGSSQTGAIYDDFAEAHESLDVLSIAAMSPIDFVLFRRRILEQRPHTVLLNLSEFDLAQWIPEEAVYMAPRQGWGLLDLWGEIDALPGGQRYRRGMARLLVGEVSPEVKYGFALRGVADEAMTRLARRLGRPNPEPPRASIEQRVEWLREAMTEEALPFDLALLERFADELEREKVGLAILEGSYNPEVLDDRLLALRERARRGLRALATRHPKVQVLERERFRALGAEDFRDLTHVKREVGAELAYRVASVLGVPSVAATPAAKERDWWRERVEEQREQIAQRGHAEIVLLGDSLTEDWSRAGSEAWARHFGRDSTLNLGLSADRTEHLLWRLTHLSLETLQPKAVVVLVGTNNVSIAGQPAEEIAAGVHAVVDVTLQRFPRARVVLMALTPRGAPESTERLKASRVNAAIEREAAVERVTFLDVGPSLVDANGEIAPEIMPDGLHLSARGYELVARAMEPILGDLIPQS